MANLMDGAADWLRRQLKTHAGKTVTYRRGSDEATLTVTVSKTEWRTTDPNRGASILIISRDFLIPAEDLVFNGSAIAPARNDEVDETGPDGTVYTHQLLPIVQGEPFWRWNDNARTVYRVHTKQVGAS